jgi:hypothetical protein
MPVRLEFLRKERNIMQKNNLNFLFTAAAIAAVASGCSNSGGSGSGSSTSNDYNQVYEALKESAPEISTTSTRSFSGLRSSSGPSIRTSLTTDWDETTTGFTSVNSDSSTLKEFISDLFNADVDQSIFERAKMPFLITCTLDMLGKKSGSLFTSGTQEMTMASSVVGVCGSESDFTNDSGSMIGSTVNAVVTNLTDNTYYDQMIYMSGDSNSQFGGNDQWMYIRNTSTTLNFMHIEVDSTDTNVSVSTISYDKATEGGSFQYVTKYGTNDASIYRILMSPEIDEARVFAYKYIPDSSRDVALSVTSTFTNQDYAALSIEWANQNSPYTTTLSGGAACIKTSDSSIEVDDTATCSTNSKTAAAVSTSSSVQTAVQSFSAATVRTDAESKAIAAKLPTFTASTILTAGLSLY